MGVPMLWQGQELAENWNMPGGGLGRNLYHRPLHWEYFYDTNGRALIRLHRTMGTLRRQHRALRSRGQFFYYNDPFHQQQGIIAYHRGSAAEDGSPLEDIIVVLNFSDHEAEAWIPWPKPGYWEEQIDKVDNPRQPVRVHSEGQWIPVRVPAHYGGLYLRH